MIQATLFAYFVLVALVLVLVVFPDRRACVTAILGRFFGTLSLQFSRSRQAVLDCWCSLQLATVRALVTLASRLVAHRTLALFASTALLAPSLIVVAVRGPTVFDLVDYRGQSNRQIGLLLEGEHLVPPLPLPPEVFVTREAETVRPDIASASRNWNLLDQEFTQRLLVVFKLMKERHGYEMVLIEGYRSPQRQEQLLAQGGHVTQVGANMSYHQHGLAADSAFLIDGRIAISERDPLVMRGYELYGAIAEQVGLNWGGRWKMQDYGHVELRRPERLGRSGLPGLAGGGA